jgi:hypothetical protein
MGNCYQYEYINNSSLTIALNGFECIDGNFYSLNIPPSGEGLSLCIQELSSEVINSYSLLGLTLTPAAVTCGSITPTPTPTMTKTPSPTPIVCGSGFTTGAHYYVDCCGNSITGTNSGQIVTFDYSKPSNGVKRMNVSASISCPTPSPTKTPTATPTSTVTPTITRSGQVPLSTPTTTPSNTRQPVLGPQNECKVFTLFDMGVRCDVVSQPSSPSSNNGILSLIVTGGTAPYSYFWDGGQRTQTLTNISSGSYGVSVVDFYGDYTATTVCSIFGPSPSPTMTMTPTPSKPLGPVYSNLCLVISTPTQYLDPIQFIPNGTQNGKPRWSGVTNNIVWSSTNSRWEITNWTLTNGLPVSTSQSDVPLSSWSMFGGTGTYTLTMSNGGCPSVLPLKVNVQTQNTSCDGTSNCNGTLIVTPIGGVPPYQYSINNGSTFQSLNSFNNLCSGSFTLVVRDSGSPQNTLSQNVVIGSNGQPTTYSISLVSNGEQLVDSQTKTSTFNVNVSPAIPVGTTISFTLIVDSYQDYNQPGGGLITDQVTITKNSNPVSVTSNNSISQLLARPNCSPYQLERVTRTRTYVITMTNGDTVSGSLVSNLFVTNPQIGVNGCVTKLEQSILGRVTLPSINGCTCCTPITIPSINVGVTSHIIQTGTGEVSEPPAYRQILLSNPPGEATPALACNIQTGNQKFIDDSSTISNGLIIYNDPTLTTKTYTSDPYDGKYAMLYDTSNGVRYAVTFDEFGNVNTKTNC